MAENNITKELNILQIIKEDIIEALGRKNKKTPSLSIEPEIKTSPRKGRFYKNRREVSFF